MGKDIQGRIQKIYKEGVKKIVARAQAPPPPPKQSFE